jgi:hypothetical protein
MRRRLPLMAAQSGPHNRGDEGQFLRAKQECQSPGPKPAFDPMPTRIGVAGDSGIGWIDPFEILS